MIEGIIGFMMIVVFPIWVIKTLLSCLFWAVKQVAGEKEARICSKDKTIELDGVVYRLSKVDLS
jgi:hypothetical protein